MASPWQLSQVLTEADSKTRTIAVIMLVGTACLSAIIMLVGAVIMAIENVSIPVWIPTILAMFFGIGTHGAVSTVQAQAQAQVAQAQAKNNG